MKIKYRIGVPKFDAAMCALKTESGETRQIGRRKAKDIVFQAILDNDHVRLDDTLHMDGHTMQVITIIDKEEFAVGISEYKQRLQS